MPDTEEPPKDHGQIRTTGFYTSFSEQLTGIEPIESIPAVDGSYRLAEYYSERLDDDILEAVKKVAKIHLSGHRLLPQDNTTTLEFLSRLRCVDSLSDYLILALQAVVEHRNYRLESWTPVDFQPEETGHLEDDLIEPQIISEVNLVHISDLMAHSKLSLRIPARPFDLKLQDSTPDNPPPAYCFVSHSWVDKGMPDTEDAKFYRSFLLIALAIYLDTGIEYFWVDYLCVTQDPAAKELKAEQLNQIPGVVQRSALYISMSLEIYQYFSSAWCALETLGFLAWSPGCRPLDFMDHTSRKTYRYGMNVVDPSKVNANEIIIYSFTDQPFTCGAAEDVEFLTTQIERARVYALTRVWRYASRVVKTVVGMTRTEVLGVMIVTSVQQFLASMMNKDAKSATQFLEEISSVSTSLGFAPISADKMKELAPLFEKCRTLCFALACIGQFWPGVRLRQGGAYDLDTSELTTGYAFHNQDVGRWGEADRHAWHRDRDSRW